MEDLAIQISPNSSPAGLLSKRMGLARTSKRLREAAATHFSGMSDAGLVTAVVLRSAGGLIYIFLVAVSAEYGGGAAVNISQVVMGCVSISSATLVSLSK